MSSLVFNNVSFKYDNSKCGYILKNNGITFVFEALTPEFNINQTQCNTFNNLDKVVNINNESTLHLLYT